MARSTGRIVKKLAQLLPYILSFIPEDDPKYANKNGTLIILQGQRTFNDSLLFNDTQKVESVLFLYPKVRSNDICYPAKRAKLHSINITSFQVKDLEPTGKGGSASVINDSGINKNKLCLRLKSRRGRSYHFNILVWGYGGH